MENNERKAMKSLEESTLWLKQQEGKRILVSGGLYC